MSKNIIIQEGGQGKQLTADKLETNLVGGGTCYWVPEDETQLTTKTITENGTYKAVDDGYFGYSEVTVNVPAATPNLDRKTITKDGIYKAVDDNLDGYSEVTVRGIGSTTGKVDPSKLPSNPGGKDYGVHTDDDGNLVFDELPDSIHVKTEPDFTGTYPDGMAIDYTGLEIEAKCQGAAWSDTAHPGGIVPISELTLPVEHADFEEAAHSSSASSDLIGGSIAYAFPPLIRKKTGDDNAWVDMFEGGTAACVVRSPQQSNMETWVLASAQPFTAVSYQLDRNGGRHNYLTRAAAPATYNGKTVYYDASSSLINNAWEWNIPRNELVTYGAPAAWTMIYGDIEAHEGEQIIPVQWARPIDGKVLETRFNVMVAPGYTPDESEEG